MQKKIEKWQEPPPAKQVRVLPAPDAEIKKRRGGRRARKYKERYGLTDTKKARSLPPLQVSTGCHAVRSARDGGRAVCKFQQRNSLTDTKEGAVPAGLGAAYISGRAHGL